MIFGGAKLLIAKAGPLRGGPEKGGNEYRIGP